MNTISFFFRCNHDLLKAIEHFNMNYNSQSSEPECNTNNNESKSAFKPVNTSKFSKTYITPHAGSFSFISTNKTFGLYPFWPVFNTQFNPQPIFPNPILVQSFCECEQCKTDDLLPKSPNFEVFNGPNAGAS